MLKQEEKALVHGAFVHGPAFLFEHGMSAQDYVAFLERPEVKAEMEFLEREYQSAEGLAARQQYMGLRRLSRLQNLAMEVVENTLKGVQFAYAPEGYILRDEKGFPKIVGMEPTQNQANMAQDVLDRLRITRAEDKIEGSEVHVNLLFQTTSQKAQVELNYAEEDQEPWRKSLSRERRLRVIEKLMPKFKELFGESEKEMLQEVSGRQVRPRYKKVREYRGKKIKPLKLLRGGRANVQEKDPAPISQ